MKQREKRLSRLLSLFALGGLLLLVTFAVANTNEKREDQVVERDQQQLEEPQAVDNPTAENTVNHAAAAATEDIADVTTAAAADDAPGQGSQPSEQDSPERAAESSNEEMLAEWNGPPSGSSADTESLASLTHEDAGVFVLSATGTGGEEEEEQEVTVADVSHSSIAPNQQEQEAELSTSPADITATDEDEQQSRHVDSIEADAQQAMSAPADVEDSQSVEAAESTPAQAFTDSPDVGTIPSEAPPLTPHEETQALRVDENKDEPAEHQPHQRPREPMDEAPAGSVVEVDSEDVRTSIDEEDAIKDAEEDPFRFEVETMHRKYDASDFESNSVLQRFLHFVQGADRLSSRNELSTHYYSALESLYINRNITQFAERAMAGAQQSGHSRLHFLLGVLYANGLGVVRSEAKAILHYTFAAIQGVPEAHVALGYRHRYGLGVPQDCPIAAMHLREAADAVAMTYDGRINPRPVEERSRTLSFSINGQPADAVSLNERDRVQRQAVERARQLDANRFRMEQGVAEAALRLGIDYLHGTMGLHRNTRLAEKYFLRSLRMRSDAGREPLADAYAYLGQIYATGDADAVPQPLEADLEKAVAYYRRGAAGGSGLALNGLGYLHVIGYLQHDETPNERRRLRAADADDDVHGQREAEQDRKSDFETAASYFSRAIIQGRTAEALYNLGVLHLHGRGVPVDLPRAQGLFEEAATSGSMLSLWQLGLIAETRGDCRRAVHYYVLVTRYGSWHDHGISPHSSVFDVNGNMRKRSSAATAEGAPTARAEEVRTEDTAETRRRTATAAVNDAAIAPGEAEAPAEPDTRIAWHRATLAAVKKVVVQAAMGYGQGREASSPPSFSTYAFRRKDGPFESPEEPSIAHFVERLALAETGSVPAAREAAALLDDDLFVADEEVDDESLVLAHVVEADHPSFAYGNRLPEHAAEAAAADTIVLLWSLPTSVHFRKASATTAEREETGETPAEDERSGEGAVFAVPWLVSQREAKRLLLLRLLHLSAGDSTKSSLRLGDFYYYGESQLVGSDAAVAFQHYKAATRDNTPQAYFNVGLMYQLGIGVPPLRSANDADGIPRDAEVSESQRRRNWEAARASALSSPLMRPWTPALSPSSALARRHRAWSATAAAPNYVLQALLRLLEGTTHNAAPLSRVWRYEGDGGIAEGSGMVEGSPAAAAVDLVAAVTPAFLDASTQVEDAADEAKHRVRVAWRENYYYYYDLNLAKRAYDHCLLYSRGSAYFAVRGAIILLNLQWWTLYFFNDILRGIVLHAAAKLTATAVSAGASGDYVAGQPLEHSPAAMALRLAKALLEGTISQLTSLLSSAATQQRRASPHTPHTATSTASAAAQSQPSAKPSRGGFSGGDVVTNGRPPAAAAAHHLGVVWQRYLTFETYLLYVFAAVFFFALVVYHHVG